MVSEVEVEVEVEKDLVPKMASHYKTLVEKEKVKDPAVSGGKEVKVENAGKEDNRKKSGQKQGSAEKGKRGKEDVLDPAREKVSSVKEVAGKTLGSAKDAVAVITEKTKELVIEKTEDEGQDRQELREEQERHSDEGGGHAPEGKIRGILGAVGEALVEIAVSTKDLVFGKGKGDLGRVEDRDVVYDLRYGGIGEQEQQDEH